VFFVNVPLCAGALIGACRLLPSEPKRVRLEDFDTRGALLVTSGMLSLVLGLIRAPIIGWSHPGTVATIVTAATILTAFVINERHACNPIAPLSLSRIKGLAAADATQLLGMAGFFSVFFFMTLYMQEVLHFSPIEAGAAYLPVTACLMVSAGLSSQLFGRIGTRPVIVGGAVVSAVGILYLS
jgi:predicted MFS family arabinose efflux permease